MSRNRWWFLAGALMFCFPSGLSATAQSQKTLHVDCSKNQRIGEALANSADELILEIRGICNEDVEVRRDNVTLRGADPNQDGVRGVGPGDKAGDAVVRVREARNVRIENLMVTGGRRNALGIQSSTGVDIVNCRIVQNARGIAAGHAAVFVTDTTVTGGAFGIGVFDAGIIECRGCTVTDADIAVLSQGGGRVQATDSFFAGVQGLFSIFSGSFIAVRNTAIAATSFGLRANDYGEIIVQSSELSGSIRAERKSLLVIEGTIQTASPQGGNLVALDSTVRLGGQSRLLGPTVIQGFSKLLLQGGSALSGDLTCSSGGDASCEDPTAVSGAIAGCGSCARQ